MIAGLLEVISVLDHTRGGTPVVLTLMLVLFAVDVPLLYTFSVPAIEVDQAPKRWHAICAGRPWP